MSKPLQPHYDAPALLLCAAAFCGVLVAQARSFLEMFLVVAVAAATFWLVSDRLAAAKWFLPLCAGMALWTAFLAPTAFPSDYQQYKGVVVQNRVNDFTQSGLIECSQGRLSFVYGGLTPELVPGDSVVFNAAVSAADRYKGIPFMAMHDMTNRAARVGGSVFLFDGSLEVTGYSKAAVYKIDNFRRSLAYGIYGSGLRPEVSRLLVAAVLGTGDADIEMKEQMRSMGLAHLLCVSGFHVGIIASIVAALLVPLQLITYRRAKYLLIPLVVWLYAALCGFAPSVIRAAVMITTFYVLRYFQRDGSLLNALAISFVIVLIINPYWLFSVGFQLSFCAVAGILVFALPLIDKVKHKKFASAVLVPFFASVATLPVLLAWFRKVALLSVPFNVVGTIIFPAFMIAGMIAAIMWHIGLGGTFFCMIANGLYRVFTGILDEMTPVAQRWQFIATPGILCIVLLSAALIFAALALARRRNMFAVCSVLCLAIAVCDIDTTPKPLIVIDNDNVHYCHQDSCGFISLKQNAEPRQYASLFDGYGHGVAGSQSTHYAEIFNTRILLLDNMSSLQPCDVLIVTEKFGGNLEKVIKQTSPKHITLSARMKPRRRLGYQYTCQAAGIPPTLLSHHPLVIFPQIAE